MLFYFLMETCIQSFIKTKSGIKEISLFGYSSKGLPGLEIHGLKQRSKMIKEKIIYLSRLRGLKLPLLKYSLCIDEGIYLNNKELNESSHYLEIPLLFMFWHLAGVLPIKKLDRCIVAGFFNIKGELYFYKTIEETSYLKIGIESPLEVSGLLETVEELKFYQAA